MENKKILHVVTVSFSLPYFVGKQFDYFKEKGHVFYVAAAPSSHFSEFTHQKGISSVELKISRKVDLLGDLIAICKLYRFIRDNNIQIVIGHTPKGGMISMMAAYFARSRTRVYFRHGIVYETSSGFKRGLLKFIETLSGYLSTKVVCVSQSILEYSKKDKLSNHRKNIILGKGTCNGIDVDRFCRNRFSKYEIDTLKHNLNVPEHSFVYGFVGRIVKDKGIHDLIKAWQMLLKRHDNIKLVLIGPFEERDAVSPEIKSYIIREPSIIYLGEVKETEEYYTLFHVFVLPSYREGFPTVNLEASSMEVPVITSKVTGCIDSIIENETGIFCGNQVEDLLDKMLYYYSERNVAKQHGKNGRLFVEKYFRQEYIWEEIEKKILNPN